MEISPSSNDKERRELIIAIDGPMASGKSTVGRMVAARLGYLHVDTGSLYRAMARVALQKGGAIDEPSSLAGLLEAVDVGLSGEGEERRVTVDGEAFTSEPGSEELEGFVSELSSLPEVQAVLLEVQRRLGAGRAVVMGGQDIGAVVFPDAEVKIFLSASDEERGRRRWKDLQARGSAATQEEVLEDLCSREHEEMSEEHAVLRVAPDAVAVDSTNADPGQVTEHILGIVESRRASAERPARGRTPLPPMKKKLKIAVLHRRLDFRFKDNFPGDVEGREDEIYIEEILEALRKRGHEAFPYTIREDALQDLQDLECDLAFNLVEEGLNNSTALEPHLPALLDVLGIPYTGGDFLSIAITADKARAKEVLSFHKIPTPPFQLFETGREELRTDLRFPLIVKPVREDAGIGISLDSVVPNAKKLATRVRKVVRTYKQPVLVEEYIHGRELSVAVFEHRGRLHVSPLSEVVFDTPPGQPKVYTYTAKWDDESQEYDDVEPTKCPAEGIDPAIEEQVRDIATRTFRALRLRGYARIDLRLSEEDRLYVLEVNVNPLIGEESLVDVLAQNMGWTFPTLINNVAMEAYRRAHREKRYVTLRDIRPPMGE